jgi:biopolymer transport protein ExbD
MRLASGYEERKARIEMVPLIDCMFLLLVFFMYAMVSMTVHRGIRVNLPKGAGATQKTTPVLLTIAPDNAIRLGDRVLDLEAAVGEAAAQAKGRKAPVLIGGDRASDLGVALELLSRLKEAGVEQVTFLVERETP